MAEGNGPERPQRFCTSCGTEVRLGNVFCVSCGARIDAVEGSGAETVVSPAGRVHMPGSPGGTSIPRNVWLLALGAGTLLFLFVMYLLGYPVFLGLLLLIGLVLAALLIRRSRGSQTEFERKAFERLGGYGRSAKEAYGDAESMYRRWSSDRTAEQERVELLRRVEAESDKRRATFERYERFFERARDGAASALDWWRAYEDQVEDDGQQAVSEYLRLARSRAEAGLAKIRQTEGPFHLALRSHLFDEADRLLDDLRFGQEDFLGDESVFAPLVAVHEKIKRLDGWANYRTELEKFVRDLEDLLDSPKIRTVAANRMRFPDPAEMRGQIGRNVPNTSSGSTSANRGSELTSVDSARTGVTGTATRAKEVWKALGAMGGLIVLVISLGTWVTIIWFGAMLGGVGDADTDPADRTNEETLLYGLTLGMANDDGKSVEDAKVNGTSATVYVNDGVTRVDAEYVCNYALDFSQEIYDLGGVGDG